jgi:hypothetical protein
MCAVLRWRLTQHEHDGVAHKEWRKAISPASITMTACGRQQNNANMASSMQIGPIWQ